MGAQFVNYQVKTDSIFDVVNEVKHLAITQAYISPPKNG